MAPTTPAPAAASSGARRRPPPRRRRLVLAAAAAAAASLLLLPASADPLPPRPDWCDKWSPNQTPNRRKAVALLVGDSITSMAANADGGWAARLAEQGPRQLDVLTRGFSGWNTRWWRPAARTVARDALGLPEGGPPALANGGKGPGAAVGSSVPRELAFATLWLGANDLVPPESDEGPKYVPVDQYEANLEAIARDVLAAGAEAHRYSALMAADGPGRAGGRAPAPVRLLIVAPAPVGEKMRVEDQARRAKVCRDVRGEAYFAGPKGPPPDRTSAASWAYSRAALRVADKLSRELGVPGGGGGNSGGGGLGGVPVLVSGLDLHPVLLPAVQADGGFGRAVYLDGVHLNPEGQRRAGEAIAKRVLQSAGEGGLGLGSFWDALPLQMPAWEQLEKAGPSWRRFLSAWVIGG